MSYPLRLRALVYSELIGDIHINVRHVPKAYCTIVTAGSYDTLQAAAASTLQLFRDTNIEDRAFMAEKNLMDLRKSSAVGQLAPRPVHDLSKSCARSDENAIGRLP